MFEILRDHPWIGAILCALAVAYWVWLFVDRRRKGKEIPAGEWIVFGIGSVALLVLLFLVITSYK